MVEQTFNVRGGGGIHERVITMRLFRILTTVLMLSLLPATALAQGQQGKRGQSAEKRQKRAAKIRARVLRKKVGLSDAKAAKVEAIVEKYRVEQRALTQTMREARRELRVLFRSDSDDQQAYQAALTKLKGANKKLQALRDKQFAELSQTLTPKEQARLLAALHKVRNQIAKRRRGQAGANAKPGKPGKRGKPSKPRRPRRPRSPGF